MSPRAGRDGTWRHPGRLPSEEADAGLDADALRGLERLVAEAERRHAREIAKATDAALLQVPFLLRPLLRRALGL